MIGIRDHSPSAGQKPQHFGQFSLGVVHDRPVSAGQQLRSGLGLVEKEDSFGGLRVLLIKVRAHTTGAWHEAVLRFPIVVSRGKQRTTCCEGLDLAISSSGGG